MHFKQPDILYFLFLLIIPILVHLFQLRRFKKEYFTNVQFLKNLALQTRKSATIKKWLLLACRLLLLALLILAFAQPYFEAKDSGSSTNQMYIVLDNSLSMQAKGQKGPLLQRAIQELLENIPDEATFSVLTNSDAFWNTNKKEIQTELQNLKYSALPFQFEGILSQIKAHKSAFKKDIIIITDAVGLEKKQLKSLPAHDNTFFIVPKAEQKNNIAIDSVYIKETLENFYDLSVDLSSLGTDIKPATIAIYDANKLIAKTIVGFETAKKTIQFTIPKQPFHGYVSIEDNGLKYDNTYYFSISKTKKTTVLSIGEAEKSNFLSRIFTPEEFDYQNNTLSNLNYNTLEKQETIILNELEEIPQALQTTLKSMAQKGCAIIYIPSAKCNLATTNAFLKQYGDIEFKNIENKEKRITKINFAHPLFANVFKNKVSNFQYPNTKTNFDVATTNSAALEYEDGKPFLLSSKTATTMLAVFAGPINSSNSNFQQSPLIVPTFYKLGINTQNNGLNTHIIGYSNPYLVPVSLSKDAILEIKNKDEQFIPVQQSINNKVKLQFNDYPEKAGNYEIFNGKEAVEKISFNYNRAENGTTKTNENLLSDYKTIESVSAVFDTLHSNRTDNQIWKWFVIFALIFLLLEMAIVKFMK